VVKMVVKMPERGSSSIISVYVDASLSTKLLYLPVPDYPIIKK